MILESLTTSRIPRSLRWGIALLLGNLAMAFTFSSQASLWLVVMYATLMVHTAGAMPFFSPIISLDHGVLKANLFGIGVIYGLLAWSLHNPIQFFLLAAVLFFWAAICYRIVFRLIPRKKFREKIRIDAMGGVCAIAVMTGIYFGHTAVALPIVAIAYLLVTIGMLWVQPYYRE